MEWITNIWAWIVAHKDGIVTFVTSSSFIGFVTTILMLIKQGRSVKANTGTSKELTVALKDNKELAEKVETLKSANETLGNKVADMTDALDKMLTKVNAQLEVQSIAYNAQLKDDKVRTAVNNVLTNAKYAETATRAALITKIEELESGAAKVQEQISETAKEVKKTLTAEDKPTVMRG